MCDLTLATFALGVASTGASVIGGMQEASAIRGQAAVNERLTRDRAAYESQLAGNQGAADLASVTTEGRRILGRSRALAASSGVSGGSTLDVLADSARTARLNEQAVQYNTRVRQQQIQYGSQADSFALRTQARFGASAARVRGLMGGLGYAGSTTAYLLDLDRAA